MTDDRIALIELLEKSGDAAPSPSGPTSCALSPAAGTEASN
jgi:hypothetical protein